ncbi:MAG TPA: hypothetical protein VL651_16970 [Bacteroidia bacterium]|jgi:hypothetical protein|nr:hypothetical protein [Bacteroidia bacterium]
MKNVLLLLVMLFSAGILEGQTVLKSGADTTKKKIHVTVMNPNGKSNIPYQGKAMHTDSVTDAAKINFLNFARGDFELYYERRLSDGFSVEAAGGVTYVDYMYEFFNNGAQFFSWANGGKKNAKFYSGFASGIQLRWFPSRYETAITGYYFSAGATYRTYKMDYFVYNGLIGIPHHLNRTLTNFNIQFGHQDADPYERTFWEWYVSVGIGHAIEDTVDIHQNDVTFYHNNWWRPVVGAGIKLGFTI